MTAFILIPFFNEELNLEELANNIIKVLPEINKFFLFVDDCSTDDSINIINNLFKSTNYHIITKEINKGPGHSFNLGFEWILEHSKSEDDIIITLEADNTSDLTILHKMVTISKLGYNLVLASVYAQGGGFDKTTLFRKIISFLANIFLRFAFNIKVLTLSSFYRVYNVALIRNIKKEFNIIITENGFISMIEILIKSIKINASIIEIPMKLSSHKRKGKSKMRIIKTTKSYIKFVFSQILKIT